MLSPRMDVTEPTVPLDVPASSRAFSCEPAAAAIAARAAGALLDELETWPKPGLVSHVDTGSHDDMDASTFRRSVAAITPFFARLAEAGADGAPLATLRQIGLDAEAAMLRATGGVNTHRGAIFALGLLCAAAGARGDVDATRLTADVRERWGDELASEHPTVDSHGARAMRRYGVGGARGEAAAGFPTAMRIGLPAFAEGRRLAPHDDEAIRVHVFFAALATVDDTNLLHRGGAEGLAFARRSAAAFMAAGGIAQPGWSARAAAVHRAFVLRRLSPGGSADLLAVTLFLARCGTQP